jgi:hypothetical protein
VQTGECNYFYTLGGQVLWQVKGRYCNTLMAVGKPFFYTSVGYVLPKGSILTDPLTIATLQLRQEDQLVNSTEYSNIFTCNLDSNPSLVSSAIFIGCLCTFSSTILTALCFAILCS